MPITTPDEATKNILDSLQKLNDPQFTKRYLGFLGNAKEHHANITDWNEKFQNEYQLGPTLTYNEERKKIIKELQSNTTFFLNITKPIPTNNPNDVPYNNHQGFNIDDLMKIIQPPLTTIQTGVAQPVSEKVGAECVIT